MNAFYRTILALLPFCTAFHAHAGLFTLEIAEPAANVGDIGTLHIVYDGEAENYAFYNGGLRLQLSSSVPGVIKFLDGQIVNDDYRWSIAQTNGITSDSINELFAASVMTPGLVGNGPRTFAEIQYSLVGAGSTEILIDAAGDDSAVEGPLGDVSSNVYSHGLCLGDCSPGAVPTTINFGTSWAQKKAALEAAQPQIPYHPPVIVTPVPTDPGTDVPPVAQQPDPNIPVAPEPVDDPVVDIPDETPSAIEIGFRPERPLYGSINLVDWLNGEGLIDIVRYPFLQIPDLQLIDVATVVDPSQFITIDSTNIFTYGTPLQLYDADGISLAYTSFSNVAYDGTALAAMRLYSLGTTNANLGALVPEPHSLLMAFLWGIGVLAGRRRSTR